MASSNDGGKGIGGKVSSKSKVDNNSNGGGGGSNNNNSSDSKAKKGGSKKRWWRAMKEGNPNTWGQYLHWRQTEYEEERKQKEMDNRFEEWMEKSERSGVGTGEDMRHIHDTYNDMAKHLGDTGARALAWVVTLGYYFERREHMEAYIGKVREREGAAHAQIGKLHESSGGRVYVIVKEEEGRMLIHPVLTENHRKRPMDENDEVLNQESLPTRFREPPSPTSPCLS